MARNKTSFAPGPDENRGHRERDAVRYAGPVRASKDKLVDRLPEFDEQLIAIALGTKTQQVINLKTGVLEEVRVDPKTQLAAIEYVHSRVMGRPDSTKVHEIGESSKQVMNILLGPAATSHWAVLQAPTEVPQLPDVIEAEVVEVMSAGSTLTSGQVPTKEPYKRSARMPKRLKDALGVA